MDEEKTLKDCIDNIGENFNEFNKATANISGQVESQVIPLAKKVKKVIDVKVVIEPRDKPPYRLWTEATQEEKLKKEIAWYAWWAREFEDFIRDHRHQDVNSVYADLTEIDACSKCGEAWEEAEEDGEIYCACCGAIIKPKQAE